jgi:hypothetical protein
VTLTLVQINEAVDDSSETPLNGTAVFTPTQTVYDSGVPVVLADTPVTAQIVNGQLSLLTGEPVQLLPNDTQGLTVEGRTGFWLWSVAIELEAGTTTITDGWDFYLPSSPSSVDLYALAGTGLPGVGMQNPMTTEGDLIDGGTGGTPERLAGNTSATRQFLVSLGTGSAPQAPAWSALLTGDVPQLADYAPTGLTGATALSRYVGATASGAPGSGTFAVGDFVVDRTGTIWVCVTAGSPGTWGAMVSSLGATMAGYLAPSVVTLEESGGNVAIAGGGGNVFEVTLTASGWTFTTPTGFKDGQPFTLRLIQDSTGGRTADWSSGWNWGNSSGVANSAPTLTTTANGMDLLGFQWYASEGKALYLPAPFPQGY